VILVADDDQMVRDTLVRELQERGYSVLQASDGLSALESLDKGAGVDLLITDYSMPGMNGLVLAEEVRRRQPRMPVLLLTGYADANVRNDVEAMQDGSISLLRKPVPADELAQHAAALLARDSQAG
jgi:CheY-like chemotaxis protein